MPFFRCKERVEIIPLSKMVCKFTKMGDYDAKCFAVPVQQNQGLTKYGPLEEACEINNKNYVCVLL